jgi:hypothetical protein
MRCDARDAMRGLFAMQYAASWLRCNALRCAARCADCLRCNTLRGLVAFARCRRCHAFDGGIFRVGFFWDRLNTHQCSYVPGQTEGLKVGCGGKNKVFIKPLALGCMGGYQTEGLRRVGCGGQYMYGWSGNKMAIGAEINAPAMCEVWVDRRAEGWI